MLRVLFMSDAPWPSCRWCQKAAGSMTMEHALSGAFHTLLAGKLIALEGIEAEKTPT